jgi:hypothetical protein
MISEAQRLLKFANETPLLQSLLYDINLMPEQLEEGSRQWGYMLSIAEHFERALAQQADGGTAGEQEIIADAMRLNASNDFKNGYIAGQSFCRHITTQAARDVLAERQRQISAEGWTPEHDDEHDSGELAAAASAYALAASDELHPASQGDGNFKEQPPPMWCWAAEWWKPTGVRRMLVKAGALILAEIERYDRAEAKAGKT